MYPTNLQIDMPFSLKATALSHGWHELAPMSWSEGGGCLQIIARNGDRPYRISVVETKRSRRKVELGVTIEGHGVTKSLVDRLINDVRYSLGLDQDLSEFYAICRDHPRLGVLPKIGGGRLLRSASMTENIVKTICATNVNWLQAVKMINRLGQLGPVVPHFRHQNAWPTPREILRSGEPYLKDICRLGYRAEQILGFCRDVCSGAVDPDALMGIDITRDGAADEAAGQLRAIKGIGPSSTNFLLSLLGCHDRLVIDSATIAQVASLHMNGKKPTPRQIEKLYEPYGRWKHLVYWLENWLTWDTAREMVRQAGLSL